MKRSSTSLVNKLLESSDVRKVLAEGANTNIRIAQFVDEFFDNTVEYFIVANDFVWYEALLDCSKEIKADYDATFKIESDSDWSGAEWFSKHWDVSFNYDYYDLCTAPDCKKAGITSKVLTEYVGKTYDLDYVAMYYGKLYLVAKLKNY